MASSSAKRGRPTKHEHNITARLGEPSASPVHCPSIDNSMTGETYVEDVQGGSGRHRNVRRPGFRRRADERRRHAAGQRRHQLRRARRSPAGGRRDRRCSGRPGRQPGWRELLPRDLEPAHPYGTGSQLSPDRQPVGRPALHRHRLAGRVGPDRRRRLGERPLRRAELIDFLPRIDQSEGRPERGGLCALLADPKDTRHPEELITRNGHAIAPPNVRGVQIDNHPVAGTIQGGHRVALDPQTEQAVLPRRQIRLLPAFSQGQARVVEEALVACARQTEQGDGQDARPGVVCQIRELAQAEARRLQYAHQAFGGGPSRPRRRAGAKPL
uniref:DUF5681 domain-containing protein n=1 Tax=Parastrongyloides trichosuri TaxID=131310 RepID=A0A0N4ZZK9_PARTI